MDNVGKVIAEWGKTSRTASEDTAAGVAAGIGVVGAGVASFLSGTTEKAAAMSVFEAAMAVATSFVNPAEAISHGVASAMFAAMAGVSASQANLPAVGGADGGTGALGGGGGSFGPGGPIRPEEAEAKSITINLSGAIVGTPQELGRAIKQQIDSMSGTGMQATAFNGGRVPRAACPRR